jgi:hypothetical protein
LTLGGGDAHRDLIGAESKSLADLVAPRLSYHHIGLEPSLGRAGGTMWKDAEEELEDHEYPDESDQDSDETAPCPYCGELIYDDAEQCPSCGKYLSREDAPANRPWWVVAGAVACLTVVIWWIATLR